MAKTYRECVYMIFDELKLFSDDTIWENEHVVFMLNKYRALLFSQKYAKKKIEIPVSYYQRLTVKFNTEFDRGTIYKSSKRLPPVIDTSSMYLYTFTNFNQTSTLGINFINPQRFRNVGYNKWLKNEIYATIDMDGYMYMTSPLDTATVATNIVSENLLFRILSEDGLSSIIGETLQDGSLFYDVILDNPMDAISFNDITIDDVLDCEFPIEESLVQPVIDLCLKELGGFNRTIRDAQNNSSDDFSNQNQPINAQR